MIGSVRLSNKAQLQRQIGLTKDSCTRASLRAFTRIGLLVEARAVMRARTNTGRYKQELRAEEAEYNPQTDVVSTRVVAGAPYSIFLELGFTGHFVPFHVADDLYFAALRRWGWRIPAPGQVKNPVAGRRYLIPRGRKSPVWGVFVKGDAHPALGPALNEVVNSPLPMRILEEEFTKELKP
jgi:hypothetical protein